MTSPLAYAAITLATLTVSTAHAVVPEYSILDLGTPGGNRSEAFGVNNAGQVVGWGKTSTGANRAFRTAPNSPINPVADLVPLHAGGSANFAYGINDAGTVAGDGSSSSGDRAFRYSPAGTLTTLGTLGGGWSYGNAVNSRGDVVGGAARPKQGNNFPTQAYVAIGDTLTSLGTLGGQDSYAYGINAAGRVVGYSQLSNFTERAFLWIPTTTNGTTGTMSNLGSLGGGYSYAWGINNANHVVGGANTTGDATYHAFVWTPSGPTGATGTMADLGTLGGSSSEARAINAAGHVVGYADTAAAVAHAFLHDGSGMFDLNHFLPAGSGWELKTARGINDVGQIVGTGTTPSGESHGYLLTPKPTWATNADGNWSAAANWIGAIPSGAGAEAQFTGAITAPHSVNLDSARTVGKVVFNSPVAYTLAGPAALTFSNPSGPASIEVRSGTHTIAADVHFTGDAALTLAAGTGLTLAGNVSGSITTLSLAESSSLDVGANELLLAYTGPAPLDSVRQYLFESRIVSSVAAADPQNLTVAYRDTGSAIELMVATFGDTDLDGSITADDFARIDRGYARGASGWANGDFDHDGQLTTADYLLIDRTYGGQVGGLSVNFIALREAQFGEGYVAALTAPLPEPGGAMLLACAAFLGGRRRRLRI
jgi:probable HAF family extracellular repeat protein